MGNVGIFVNPSPLDVGEQQNNSRACVVNSTRRYNSVVYSTIGTNDFYLVPATQDWLDKPFDNAEKPVATLAHAEASSYDHLDNSACISAYKADYLADRSTLILVGVADDKPLEQDFFTVLTHRGPDRDW